MSTPFVLDCDPGHDDAIALLLALASPELELLGVTTVSGNQTLEKTTANALKILEFTGRTEIPVAVGANRPLVRAQWAAAYVHGESGLDGPDLPAPTTPTADAHAIDFIAAQVRAHDGVVLAPVGPLTNVALFLGRYPELERRVARIVLMGGAIGLGNVTPAAEFNIWADPEAAHRVFHSTIDKTMIGLDVTHEALMYDDDAERLRASGRTGQLVAELYDFFHLYHRRQYGLAGSPIHDAVAVAHVIRGDLVETQHRYVTVDTGPDLSRGRTYVDLWQRTENEPNCHAATAIDGRGFIEFLTERLTSLG